MFVLYVIVNVMWLLFDSFCHGWSTLITYSLALNFKERSRTALQWGMVINTAFVVFFSQEIICLGEYEIFEFENSHNIIFELLLSIPYRMCMSITTSRRIDIYAIQKHV